MRRALVVAAVLLGLAGCYVGPRDGTFAPANGPRGITADLRLKGSRIQGELLEVQDTALLMLRDERVLLVPLRAIRRGRFGGRGAWVGGGEVRGKVLTRLRLMSRFPAGLTPEMRTKLLAAQGQTDIEGVAP